MIKLPPHITGAQPTGKPDDLRMVRPTFLAPALTDTKAISRAIGAHVIRLPRRMEARAAKLDGVPVLFARDDKQLHVLVDSLNGVMEIDGLSAEQVAGIREWMDAAAVAPENQSELENLLERIAARDPGRVDLDPKATDRDTKRAFQLIGLSATDDREVDRLLALAATMDDGASSGDAEVDRLARMAETLGDG